MEMQQLRHFLAVVRLGSIGAAADALNLSQPGLSRSIRALEEVLGTPLFERKPRGVELTDYGHSLLPRAEVICNEHDRAMVEAQSIRALRSGDVHLGLHGVATWIGAARILGDFFDAHPAISVATFTASGPELLGRVASAEIDLAFTLFPDDNRDAGFVYEDLFALPCHIYQRAGAARPIADAAALGELADRNWALSGALNFRAAFEAAFAAEDVPLPSGFIQCSSLGLLLELVLSRDLLTILPRRVADAPRHAGMFERCPAPAPGGRPRGGLVYRAESLRIPAVRAMVDRFRVFARGLDDKGDALSPAALPD